MITFNRKFYFSNLDRLPEITGVTLGATVHADGSFEAAADQDLPDGEQLGISPLLSVRITARNDKDRVYWAWRILNELPGDASLDTTERGYWGPTNEYEPSWRIDTNLSEPTPDLWLVLYHWMLDADQSSVYLEWGGQVRIYDREEIPAFAFAGIKA